MSIDEAAAVLYAALKMLRDGGAYHDKPESWQQVDEALADYEAAAEDGGTVYLPPKERAAKQDQLNRRYSDALMRLADG